MRAASTNAKIAKLAHIPSASTTIAVMVNPGVFRSCRTKTADPCLDALTRLAIVCDKVGQALQPARRSQPAVAERMPMEFNTRYFLLWATITGEIPANGSI